MRQHARPLLGFAYVLVLALLIAGTIAVYNKALPWQSATRVTLTTGSPGLELHPRSDVKLQGVRVGEVRRITTDGRSATIELALDDDKLALIPANVDAAIVPKTLFGEKFVDLRVPAQAASARIGDGDIITQSETSVELGELFGELVPLLRALKPEQLSVVLSQTAEALDHRGEALARVFVQLESFLGELEPHLDTFTHDVGQFARTSEVYADAAPDLLDLLANSAAISSELLVPKEKDLGAFLDSLVGTSRTATAVLRENTEHIVTLSGRARPVLALLEEYSTSIPCFLEGLHTADTLANQATGTRGPFINLRIDMVTHRKPYVYPEDLPSNPRSDAHNSNLPTGVPNWKPHCPEFAPWVYDLEDVEPFTMPLPGQAIDPPVRGQSGAAFRSAVVDAKDALARATAAQLLGVGQDELPPYAGLLIGPLLSDGEVALP